MNALLSYEALLPLFQQGLWIHCVLKYLSSIFEPSHVIRG